MTNQKPQLNRRPFRITSEWLAVNGVRVDDVIVSSDLTDEQRQLIEDLTNDRFSKLLDQSEAAFGPLDARRYQALVDSFVENVVKSCCKTA